MTDGFVKTIRILATPDWLTASRVRAYVFILAVLTVAIAFAYIRMSSGVHDPLGRAVGTDFSSFWTAARLASDGDPAGPWNLARHQAAQVAMFGPDAGYAAFFYPPPYLLVCLPLAAAPYLISLTLWLCATLGLYVASVRAWMGRAWPGGSFGWLAMLAFPAVLINAGHGQNGFLTAALFGTAALISTRRPWLSGVLFGCLIIKPHLALLVPVFFILSGNWRGFMAAGATAAGLCLLSLVVFGPGAWTGFVETSALARATLEQNLVGYAKMQSAYAGARLLGADNIVAWGAQCVMGVAALALLWKTRAASEAARGAAMCCATLMATPFLLDYDLTLLAIPLAWLFRDAIATRFREWEKLALLAGYVLPLVARPIATHVGLPLTPLIVAALALCVVRRATADAGEAAPAQALSFLSLSRS